jgi:hypothetical protein
MPMRFAEVFLRLGCSLVGWMVIIAYSLWLAVTDRVGCGADGDQLYRLLLYAAPAATALAFLTHATRPMPEIHDILRWIGFLPGLLLPFILVAGWRFGRTVLIDGQAICGGGPPPAWQLVWLPVQLAAVLVIIGFIFRMWSSKADAAQ